MEPDGHPQSVQNLLSSATYQITYFECSCSHVMKNSNKDAIRTHLNGKAHKQGLEANRILQLPLNEHGNIICFCGQELFNEAEQSFTFDQIKAHVGRRRHTAHLKLCIRNKRSQPEQAQPEEEDIECGPTDCTPKKKLKGQSKLLDFFSGGHHISKSSGNYNFHLSYQSL